MAKRKSTGIISDWALQVWGSRGAMCAAGKLVFDKVIELEKAGRSATQIVSLFDQDQIDEFVVGKLSSDWNDEETVQDEIQALDDLFDSNGANYHNFDFDRFSPEFQLAVKKEQKRLVAAATEDPDNYVGETPVFERKGSKVVVTFK